MIRLLIFLPLLIGVQAKYECCSGNNTLGRGKCLDGSPPVKLNCDARYILDPNLDSYEKFSVEDDYILYNGKPLENSERFCLSYLPGKPDQVALICVKENNEGSMYTIRAIAASLSVIFLILTIITYIIVPKLRDLQGTCTLISIIGLAASFLVLSFLQFDFNIPLKTCEYISFFMYFSFLVAFFWLNIVSFNIWKTATNLNINGSNKMWFKIYCAYGFGGPTLLLIVSIITSYVEGDHIKPGFGQNNCWFAGEVETWIYFYGPISILLFLNIVFFTMTSIHLRKSQLNCTPQKVKLLQYRFWLYLKLFFVMGLTWIFEVLSFLLKDISESLDYIWEFTDYLNALQGVLIFLILVVLRKSVRRSLAETNVCGITFPKSWKILQDDECDEEKEPVNNAPTDTRIA